MKQKGRAWMVNRARPDFLCLPLFHLSFLYRGGAGGGVAGRGGAILLGNGGGHTPGSRGVVVYANTATSCHSEEEAGQLHGDAEEQKQAASQRRAGRLHGDSPAQLDPETNCLSWPTFMNESFIKVE